MAPPTGDQNYGDGIPSTRFENCPKFEPVIGIIKARDEKNMEKVKLEQEAAKDVKTKRHVTFCLTEPPSRDVVLSEQEKLIRCIDENIIVKDLKFIGPFGERIGIR